MSTLIEEPTCSRSASVRYRSRAAQAALATPMVNWPSSSPALTTFRANGEGRAAQTCSNARARACALVLRSDNRLPPKLINSLILLGFFTLIGLTITNLCTKTVQFSLFRPTLFCIVYLHRHLSPGA